MTNELWLADSKHVKGFYDPLAECDELNKEITALHRTIDRLCDEIICLKEQIYSLLEDEFRRDD